MINLKVGSLIKLVSSKHDDIQYVPVVNSTTKQHDRMPIGSIGLFLKFIKKDLEITGFAGYETVDLLDELITSTNDIKVQFLYGEQIYETYYIFVEPL
jgi:hypothetical protein